MTLRNDAQDVIVESDAQLAARFVHEAMPFHTILLRAARRLTHSQADAEDLVQDTLMNAYAGFRRFERGTNLRAWLFRILHNRWISTHRMKQRRPDTFAVGEITDSDMLGNAIHSGTAERSAEDRALDVFCDDRIRDALLTLPEGFRTVLYYADIEGFTCAQTAALMGIPLGTVMSRISRSRERLRVALAEVADDRWPMREEADTQRVA
ncbi:MULTISPECIES: sigma-70 family RNA polymerase sigma factor [unclassified Mycolicibacterium]|uniref:sigma-70 family RNA polymerase sigma factor n=1 Tax=unclassified Mycolicibacterium TaxID=2636767 RepID=UPI0012DF1710|nr:MULTISPECIES: sigma-70 family RNA polymerase sigma factor [unclassified Mycolicibacterium]MUL81125.1 sigma-70 family RNA polymerase sigma factor [Mycolicibacterium sp. CBMA 329]MUL86891.1 sigma-70 family RNA polymerase sigma factor [Mycolicibacterium sp. CBMA 331]MUL98825.1 sigma-70 family RNA polymerase sigma factor [Mycolicibacterium sp. CBMA 334]MUM29102.1 sigma-70 family RNA polymerase sigma factor [Mycolicibacterium sp. CBMA 295]MUM37188.1 sigma-70 family RNA polymerase sigma factor [M